MPHQSSSDLRPSRTPGYKAVLVSDEAYLHLKAIQSIRTPGGVGIASVRFDLKDIVTAFVEEAMTVPGFQERVLCRVTTTFASLFQTTLPTTPRRE